MTVAANCVRPGQSTNVDSNSSDDAWGEDLDSIHEGSFVTDLGSRYGSDCSSIRLRQRHANGSYGEPVFLIGTDAERFELFDNTSLKCTADGIEHAGRMAPEDRPGCAVVHESVGGRPKSSIVAVGSLVLALLRLRRRPAARATT
jgi:hypothetical protein